MSYTTARWTIEIQILINKNVAKFPIIKKFWTSPYHSGCNILICNLLSDWLNSVWCVEIAFPLLNQISKPMRIWSNQCIIWQFLLLMKVDQKFSKSTSVKSSINLFSYTFYFEIVILINKTFCIFIYLFKQRARWPGLSWSNERATNPRTAHF